MTGATINSAFRLPPPKMKKTRPGTLITSTAWNALIANINAKGNE